VNRWRGILKRLTPQGTNRIALSDRLSPSSTAVGHQLKVIEENESYKEQVFYD